MSTIQIKKSKKEISLEIKDFCHRHDIKYYSISKNLSVNVYQNVRLVNLHNLPIKFNECHGDFSISAGNLLTLENTPRIVHGNFSYHNGFKRKLKSLSGHPDFIGGYFSISSTDISEIDTLPIITGSLNLYGNKIESIEYNGKIFIGSNPLFNLKTSNSSDNPSLTQFESTPIYKLCLEINTEYWKFYDKWMHNQVILERINEFSVVDGKSVDYIRLNDLYDFLEIPFYSEILCPKIEKLGYSIN